ncbi:tail protein [Bacillus phage KonjoTrouble]|uniref:Major tail protein n=2 Tax=Claudivirus konjotrouble TaxID=2843774 RepID=A0A514AAJ7_9CAUD|nr:tail protein [Bacillus phage KonjoTrouble]ASU04151.1 tail protein [Bacillus phage KonjoTrouble]QDH50310.1 major tail protein [Bacillus phage VioletteMad]
MAVVPLSGSNVFFKKGVPFSNDNKHTRWFDNINDQFSYFSSRPTVHAMDEVKFVENNGKNYIGADAGIDSLRDVNYIMFQNTQYNNKWFYAFVTQLKRKTSSMTEVYFEIDVLQTWRFEMTMLSSFVVREHCPLWNPDGTPVINTIDEGLNYGTEYETVNVHHHIPNSGIRFLVIACKKAVHGTNKDKVLPSLVGVGQPFSYYVVPFVDKDVVVNATIQGESHRMSTLIDTLASLYKDDKMTNNIVTMFITEQTGLKYTTAENEAGYGINFSSDGQVVEYAESDGAKMVYVSDCKQFSTKNTFIGSKYDGYRSVKESKLLMYPYTVLTLDDMQGNRRDFKNEYISRPDITLTAKGSLGTSNKVSYSIAGYNMDINSPMHQFMLDEWGIQNINPNDVSIITELISAYIQGNKNQLHNQVDQITLNGTANVGQSLLGAGTSLASGSYAGVASSGIGAVKGAGNSVLQLQAISAKIDDIMNVPPTINKMGTNTSYDVGNGFNGVFLIKKQIKPEYQKKLEDFFKLYGYKKNEVKVPNLHTRQNWNYVQTKDVNIIGDFNTEDLNELKAIFDGGITLWHTNDVGNYTLSNEVI